MSSRGYASGNLAARALAALFPLHSGSLFGNPGRVLMMAASFSMPLFLVTGGLLFVGRRRAAKRRGENPPAWTTTPP